MRKLRVNVITLAACSWSVHEASALSAQGALFPTVRSKSKRISMRRAEPSTFHCTFRRLRPVRPISHKGNLTFPTLCMAVDCAMWNDDNLPNDAAGYNKRILRKLERAFARQPDLDLSSALPPRYRSRLASKKQIAQSTEGGIVCPIRSGHRQRTDFESSKTNT